MKETTETHKNMTYKYPWLAEMNTIMPTEVQLEDLLGGQALIIPIGDVANVGEAQLCLGVPSQRLQAWATSTTIMPDCVTSCPSCNPPFIVVTAELAYIDAVLIREAL